MPTAGRAPSSGSITAVAAGAIRCITTSPADTPGCWRGLAPVAAGVVVVLGGGLLVADLRRGRRAPHPPAEPAP